jgi:hypothetical protein
MKFIPIDDEEPKQFKFVPFDENRPLASLPQRTTPPSMAAPRPLGEEMGNFASNAYESGKNSLMNLSRGASNLLLQIPQDTGINQQRQRAQLVQLQPEQQQADIAQSKRNEAYPAASFIGSIAPSLLMPANTIPKAFISGALNSGLQYQQDPTEQLKSGAEGGVLSALLSSLLSPRLAKDPQAIELEKRGINLTPGQMADRNSLVPSTVKYIEDSMSSIPFVGGQVRARQADSLASFNNSEINKALETIPNKSIDTKTTGFNAIDTAHQFISDHYDEGLKGVKVNLADDQIKAIKNASDATNLLPPSYLSRFNTTVDSVLHPLTQSGFQSGDVYKEVISNLNTKIRKFNRSTDPVDDQIAEHLMQTKDELNNQLHRVGSFLKLDSNSANFDPTIMLSKLSEADTAFARMIPIDKAVSQTNSSTGLFTPHSLYSAIRSETSNAQTTARGRGFNQKEAAQARNILPSQVPDSGTAGRAMVANLLTGAFGGHLMGSTPAGLAVGAGLTALGSPTGSKLVKQLLYGQTPVNEILNHLGVVGSQPALNYLQKNSGIQR